MTKIVEPNIDNSALVVADLQLNNIELAPLPGTPLYSLLAEIASLLAVDLADIEEPLSPEAALTMVANTINNCPELGALVQDLVALTARAVKTNIQVAQQQTLPIIREIVDAVEQAYKERVEGIGLNVEVVTTKDVAIWTSGKLETFLTEENDVNSVSSETPSCFVTSPEDIVALLKTGATSFDSEIDQWLQGIADSTNMLALVWARVFAAGDVRNIEKVVVQDMDYNSQLATFLIARSLLAMDRTTMTDMADNITLANLLTSLTQVRDYAAFTIRAVFQRRDKAKARGEIILAAPTAQEIKGSKPGSLDNSFQILVDGDLYEAFLANGGSADAVIGGVIQEGRIRMDKLMANINLYTKVAARTADMIAETAETQRLSVARDALRKGIYNALETFCEEGNVSQYRNRSTEIAPVVEDLLRKLNSKDIKDLYQVATDVVCATLFPSTDVKIIIENINRQGQADEGAAVRELATKAAADYIAAFLVSNLVACQHPL